MLPQLIKERLLLHGVALELLLHAGKALGGVDDCIVAVAALAGLGITLTLEAHFLSREGIQLLAQSGTLQTEGFQCVEVQLFLGCGLLILGNKAIQQRLATLTVGEHIRFQLLEIFHAAQARILLRLQGRHLRLLAADLLGEGIGGTAGIFLSAALLLSLGAELISLCLALGDGGLHGGAALRIIRRALGEGGNVGLFILNAEAEGVD